LVVGAHSVGLTAEGGNAWQKMIFTPRSSPLRRLMRCCGWSEASPPPPTRGDREPLVPANTREESKESASDQKKTNAREAPTDTREEPTDTFEEPICGICLKASPEIQEIPCCKTDFHPECIHTWFLTKKEPKTCPSCREVPDLCGTEFTVPDHASLGPEKADDAYNNFLTGLEIPLDTAIEHALALDIDEDYWEALKAVVSRAKQDTAISPESQVYKEIMDADQVPDLRKSREHLSTAIVHLRFAPEPFRLGPNLFDFYQFENLQF